MTEQVVIFFQAHCLYCVRKCVACARIDYVTSDRHIIHFNWRRAVHTELKENCNKYINTSNLGSQPYYQSGSLSPT